MFLPALLDARKTFEIPFIFFVPPVVALIEHLLRRSVEAAARLINKNVSFPF